LGKVQEGMFIFSNLKSVQYEAIVMSGILDPEGLIPQVRRVAVET